MGMGGLISLSALGSPERIERSNEEAAGLSGRLIESPEGVRFCVDAKSKGFRSVSDAIMGGPISSDFFG